jgi:hypothetical protein
VDVTINPGDQTVLGYVVLTQQITGALEPDWDGELHRDRRVAQSELADATEMLGFAVLAEVRLLASARVDGTPVVAVPRAV